MVRDVFHKHLADLQDAVLEMGSMVERAVERSVTALLDRDPVLAQQVVEGDLLLNAKNFECQNDVVAVLGQQAPLARDLRMVVSVAAISTELERMGDHAEGIGRIVLMMQDEPLVKPLVDIPTMANHAREMTRDAVQAFVDQDVDAAYRVGARDDEVDLLYERVYRDLVDIMVGDPSTIEPATHLLWVAHNLERIGDRATNIAERTVYAATGSMPQMDVPAS